MITMQVSVAQEMEGRQNIPLERTWPTSDNITDDWPEPIMDSESFIFLQFDRLEAGFGENEDFYTWDFQGWAGGDYHKLWVKSEGEGVLDDSLEEMEVQVLYDRLLTSFWDIQIGGRYDPKPDPDRGHLVFGIQGLAPYLFEIDTAMFVSDKGDVTFRAELEYELLITQRLILQPRFEINAAAQAVQELELGGGVNNTELGMRLRYEIKREFAPYIGLSWTQFYGETGDNIRAAGQSSSDVSIILGFRVWY